MDVAQKRALLTVTGNEVHVHADQGSMPATLVVDSHPHLVVTLNGAPLTGRCAVGPGDSVDVQLNDTPMCREARVTVSEDGVTAHLHLKMADGTKRRLRPVESAPLLVLRVEEMAVPPLPFDLDEIKAVLSENKITYGIDEDAVARLIETGDAGECVCARGVGAKDGQSERYELIVETAETLNLIGIVPIQPVLTVKEGIPVAQYRPKQDGLPGINVHGLVIPPPPLVGRLPQLGKGVQLEGTGCVRATRAGRVVSFSHLLDVAETLTLERGLKAADGYIVFDADVVVRGDVEEGSEITAGGCVFVSGVVSHAKITADQGIIVSGGVFGSTLRAGTRTQAMRSLAAHLDELAEDMRNYCEAVEQVQRALSSHGATAHAGAVAARLLDEKFRYFRDWTGRLSNLGTSIGASLGLMWKSYVSHVASAVSVQELVRAQDTEPWYKLLSNIQQRRRELPGKELGNADIQVRNAQNSDVEATGNIVSTTQGFYQSRLNAGNAVRSLGSPGVILACDVQAASIQAREIGSQAETHTSISLTTKSGSVHANLLHGGTVLAVDAWRHKVPKELLNVTWP